MHFTEDFSKPKIIYPNMTKYTALKEPAFNCSFVHKGRVLPQYSYWITPVLLLDTPVLLIGLLQYSYWITPVLLLEYSSTSIGIYKSTECFLRADAPSATSRCTVHPESPCPPVCPFTDYISLKRSLFY